MALDNAKNFAKVTVSIGYDAAATSIVLSGGEGAKLPTAPFNVVWYDSTTYTDPTDDPNKEIVRVTVVSTDTLTVTRAQEGTSAATHNTGGKTYKMIAGLTALGANSLVVANDLPDVGYLEPRPQTNTSAFVPGAGTWYFAPFIAPGNMSGGRINNLVVNTSTAGIAQEVTSVSFQTAAGHLGSKTQQYTHSFWNAMYSQGTGTNSTRLESFWSNTFSFGLSNNLSITSAGAGSSVQVSDAWSISYISEIGSDGAYTLNQFNSAVSSTGTGTRMPRADVTNAALSIRNMLSNSVIWPVGFNTTITGGAYWMAQMYSSTTASTTAGGFNQASALIFSNLNQVYIQGVALESYRNWGSTATTARSGIFLGQGMAYTAASAAPPQYVAISSDLSTVAGNNVPYFNFMVQGITK